MSTAIALGVLVGAAGLAALAATGYAWALAAAVDDSTETIRDAHDPRPEPDHPDTVCAACGEELTWWHFDDWADPAYVAVDPDHTTCPRSDSEEHEPLVRAVHIERRTA